MLRRGATGYLINDLEYVLNHFANHHAALDALSRLVVREGRSQPRRAEWPIECRFQWARQVNPEDAMVPFIQGLHAFRMQRMEDARKYLGESAEMAPENPEVHYNLGLVLFDLEEYQAARDHARKAYAQGYPLSGLRDMLQRKGYSVDAPEGEDE
ncbi:MAG: tetratricopeptide repeat protein [Ectothiorhodospira sp.]